MTISERQLGLLPERPHQGGAALHGAQASSGVGFQVSHVDGTPIRQLVMFQMAPDVFGGIEFGRVRRQRLDTCDREVMSWVATTGGISGEMIRDLMLESVERRFNDQQTPHPIEWLSDNGSCYRAHDTVSFAQSIGLVPCFTPVRSPQSNGMAESFVKTFKRDYVYVHDRPDAQSVLAQLPRWFEDYNDNHPHKALRMKSPRDFIRSFHQPAANCAV